MKRKVKIQPCPSCGGKRSFTNGVVRGCENIHCHYQCNVDDWNRLSLADHAIIEVDRTIHLCPDCAVKELRRLYEIEAAWERSEFDISPCRCCGLPTVCVPDGMSSMCEPCQRKESEEETKSPICTLSNVREFRIENAKIIPGSSLIGKKE